jgi:DNA end-binding protein Ku
LAERRRTGRGAGGPADTGGPRGDGAGHAARGGPGGGDEDDGAADEGPDAGPHAVWSGVITFGLVSVPVDLFAGLRRTGVTLHQVTADGVRLRRRFWCPEEDRPVSPDELVRGAECGDGRCVEITDEELASLAPERSREIDLRRFVPRDAIPAGHFVRPYILAPAGETVKAYRLLAAAMEQDGRAGIATFVMRGKEYLVAILADGGLLRAETLRFPGELRSADQVELPEEERASLRDDDVARMAAAVEAATTARFPWEELRDDEERQLRDLLDDKLRRGVDVIHPVGAADGYRAGDEDEEAEVVDIMQVIKERMAAAAETAEAAQPAPAERPATARKTAGAKAGRPAPGARPPAAKEPAEKKKARPERKEADGDAPAPRARGGRRG